MKSETISTDNSDGKTQEGKDRAKFNNLRHGLTAMEVCIPSESHEVYEQRRQAYYSLWKPENIVEQDAMYDYIAARWRKRRVIKYETALSIEARLRLPHEHELTYDTLSPVQPDTPVERPAQPADAVLPNEPIEEQPAFVAATSAPIQPSADPGPEPEQADEGDQSDVAASHVPLFTKLVARHSSLVTAPAKGATAGHAHSS